MKQIQLSFNITDNTKNRVDFTLIEEDDGLTSVNFYDSPNRETSDWEEIHTRTREKILDEVKNNRLQSKLGW